MTCNRNNVIYVVKAEVRHSFITTTVWVFGNNVPGHTTRVPQVGFELATKCIQFYAIANLDKTSITNMLNKMKYLYIFNHVFSNIDNILIYVIIYNVESCIIQHNMHHCYLKYYIAYDIPKFHNQIVCYMDSHTTDYIMYLYMM